MKKLIIALLLVCIGMLFADPVVIGDGTATGTHLPMEPYYGYTYSQVIYTAEEIGAAVNIENIAWHYNGNSAWTEDEVVIYLGHTTMTDFGDEYPNWIDVAELTEVYTGPFTVMDFEHLVTVELDEIFEYNGTDNLVVAFDANTTGCTSSTDEFYGTATSLNRSIYFYSDSNNPDPAEPPTGTYREYYDELEAAKTGKTIERGGGVQAYIANIILNSDGVLPSGFINGYVYDAADESIIEGATVSAGNFTALSDENGFYEIEVLAEGEYTITATHPDYLPAEAGPVNVVFDATVSADIFMDINDLEGDQPGTAIAIDAFPYYDSGDTSIGFTNFIGNNAADVFYTFTISETKLLDIHSCGSEFDTYLRLYDDEMTQVDYDDDGCSGWPTGLSSASRIGDGEGTLIDAGTYYICIEGFSSNTGYYELTVEELLPPEFGSIDGTVTDELTGSPLAGVEVEIGDLEAVTDDNGYYSIAEIETGIYPADYELDGYFGATVEDIEIIADHNVTVDVALEPIMYGNIEGTVVEQDNGTPIAGAEVQIEGTTVTTDENGYYLAAELEAGLYDVAVFADGYYPIEVSGVEVLANETTTQDIELEVFLGMGDTMENPIIVDAYPYFMSGDIAPYSDNTTVIDLEYGRSGKDIFYQLDLPDGATAELHGCGSEFDTYMNLYDDTLTRVAYDDDGCSDWGSGSSAAPWIGQDQGTYNVILAPGTYYLVFEAYSSSHDDGYFEVHLDIEAAPEAGILEGSVVDNYSGSPIAGATVTCGDENAVTDENGQYNIPFVLTGTYEVSCEASGFNTAVASDVVISGGLTTTLDFALDIVMLQPTGLTAVTEDYNVNLSWFAPGAQRAKESPISRTTREFTGSYNVYRDGELIGTAEAEEYIDEDLTAGYYEYHVTSVYEEGESAASETVMAVVGNAEITYDPAELEITMAAGSTLEQEITIGNAGDLDLDYEAEIVYLEGRTAAEVYPMSADYWTGTANDSAYIQNSLVDATPGNEAWMMFDVSDIPDYAVIDSIECHVYVNDAHYPYWSLTPCTLNPMNTAAGELAAHIESGNGITEAYSYNNESSSFGEGWYTYNLEGNAAADLAAALTGDWFAVGASPRDSGTSYYTRIDGWNEANPPYLVIHYNIPIYPWLTFAGNMGVSGTVAVGETANTHVMTFDTAELSTGDMVTGEIRVSSNDLENSEVIIPVSLTVGSDYLYGDVTGNGAVDAFDAANILQYAVGLDPVGSPLPWTWQLTAGDVDGNESVEAYDAALILQYAVGIIDQFPVDAREYIQAPAADVVITAAAGELICRASGELYGFSVTAETELITFEHAEINYLHAVNGNAIALASEEPLSGEFLRIPYSVNAEQGEFTLNVSINGSSKDYIYNVEDLESLPLANAVLGNYPNPFNPVTLIKLQAKETTSLRLDIYNVKGQLVKTLADEVIESGIHSFTWNGIDDKNKPVSSGVYFYNVKMGELNETHKMIMLK